MVPLPAEATISTPATLEGLDRVTEVFEAFASAHGIPDAARRAVQIVLDELLSNTARCGKVDGREPTVAVGFLLADGALVVEVVDDGLPFDPLGREEPDTTLPIEERPLGGLGVMLVRRLVDEVRYDGDGGRNRLWFRKRLDP